MQYISIFLLTLSLILVTNSCFRELETIEPVLEEETLIKVLADIHLAEARLSDYNSMKQERRDSFAAAYYYSIFEIHEVDSSDFQQSMQAYMGNPEKMNALYEKVLTRLQQNETKFVRGSRPKTKETDKDKEKGKKKKNTFLKHLNTR